MSLTIEKKVIAAAAIIGVTGIALGAFGAHGLKKMIAPESVMVFETGVRYQIYHALFLLFVGSTALVTERAKKTIVYLTVSGVLLFSVSIYFLACDSLFSFDFKKIGIITPIGGLLLITAWIVLLLNIIKRK